MNVALFGFTAKALREENPELAEGKNNVRDFATVNELTVHQVSFVCGDKTITYNLREIAEEKGIQ